MSNVTHILAQIDRRDATAAEQLLPLVYDELRKLAAAKLAQEKPGQTLQATALVHEAYVRLVGGNGIDKWDSRGHLFCGCRGSDTPNTRRKYPPQTNREAWRRCGTH
jgi:ECF sigma factor